MAHDELADALLTLRTRIGDVRLPLETASAETGRADRARVLDQLDDYLLPRLRDPGAPVLVVVGGSTGAGKSTIVNSLVGAEVSLPGVLRPTTRWPVLVHHPLDAAWFTTDRVGGAPPPAGRPPAPPRSTPPGSPPPGCCRPSHEGAGERRLVRRPRCGSSPRTCCPPVSRSSTHPTSTPSRRPTASWPPSCS